MELSIVLGYLKFPCAEIKVLILFICLCGVFNMLWDNPNS